MAFLRSQPAHESAYDIRAGRVRLRPLIATDYVAWADVRSASRDYLTPWEPNWAADELTRAAFRRRLKHYARQQAEDLGYAFALLRAADDGLIGGLTLSNVRRGVAQTATLGYWLGEPYIQRGYMTEAVLATLSFAFEHLRLHRLEAACLAHNTASIRVLEKCGFRREGIARRYLKIDGMWQDHVLFGLVEDEPRHEGTGR